VEQWDFQDIKMGRLLVLRHGETDFNRQGRYQGSTDTKLNEQGLIQARQAAANLAHVHIDRIVSSPLKRALETARVVAEFAGTEVETIAEFAERRLGAFEGLTKTEIDQRYPEDKGWKMMRQFYAAPPKGESLLDFSIRVKKGLETLRGRAGHEEVLLVCHGYVARSIHGIMRRVSDESLFSYNLQNCETDIYEW
jgi:broad specificity phosphatase PhoE